MILDQLRQIIAGYMDVDAQSIPESATAEQLALDSLDIVEIALDIEEELGVDLDGIPMPATLRELAAQLASRL